MAEHTYFASQLFWEQSEKIASLKKGTRYFLNYLFTSPHSARCGIYQTAYRSITFHTEETQQEVDAILRELEREGLAKFTDGWMILPPKLGHHKWAAGNNEWKGTRNEFYKLPASVQQTAIEFGYPLDYLLSMASSPRHSEPDDTAGEGSEGVDTGDDGTGDDQTSGDNKREGKVKEGKGKKEKRVQYGSHVQLTDSDYGKLVADHGEAVIRDYIARVNDYCAASRTGGYKDYAAATRNFLRKAGIEKRTREPPSGACPVCDKPIVDGATSCPECELPYADIGNDLLVSEHRTWWEDRRDS